MASNKIINASDDISNVRIIMHKPRYADKPGLLQKAKNFITKNLNLYAKFDICVKHFSWEFYNHDRLGLECTYFWPKIE